MFSRILTNHKAEHLAIALGALSICALNPAFNTHALANADLKHSTQIGSNLPFETVELPCEYRPAIPGESLGYVQILNSSSNVLNGGLPVNYRLSSTGGEFTFHMPTKGAQWQVAQVAHKHTVTSACTAWTIVR